MKNLKLYQEELLDQYMRPRNTGLLSEADIITGNYNPSCGDAVSLSIKLTEVQAPDNQQVGLGYQVHDIKFEGSGCVISIASASLLTDHVKHKDLEYLEQLTPDTIFFLIKIPLGPTRLRCALLALEALQAGVKKFRTGAGNAQST